MIEVIQFKGSEAVRLVAPDGAEATVMLHGAQVVSWKPDGATERLYLSPTTSFAEGGAIRGGVPICLPQFSVAGSLPMHGFVRNHVWTLLPGDSDQENSVTLAFQDNDVTRAIWPHAFATRFKVSVSARHLKMELSMRNSGTAPLTFTAALHTYFAVADIGSVRISGLKGKHYLDKVLKLDGQVETADAFAIDREIDRVYASPNKTNTFVLTDGSHTMRIVNDNMPDTVIWNPWIDRAIAIPDLPDDGYKHMVCIEGVAVNEPVTLTAGQEWQGGQTLFAE